MYIAVRASHLQDSEIEVIKYSTERYFDQARRATSRRMCAWEKIRISISRASEITLKGRVFNKKKKKFTTENLEREFVLRYYFSGQFRRFSRRNKIIKYKYKKLRKKSK